jgi:pimeloyl-ACP methyl ester carboxylesterase
MLVVHVGVLHPARRYSHGDGPPDEDGSMRFVPAPDGISLAVHEHGGEGRPTLLCHATGLHGAVFEPLSDALGSRFERWAIDFRAHGASQVPPDSPLPWSLMGDDVLTVVDALGVDPGRLLGVGHSLGGAALLMAEQVRPGTFAGLWLFEPIAPPPAAAARMRGSNPLADGAERRRPSFASHAEALANYASKPPLNVARADALHAYVRHGLVAAEDGAVHLACRPADEARVFRGTGVHDTFRALGTVTCPVRVVCGLADGGPAAFAPQVADALPRGTLERREHLGHFGPMEAPAELAASIRAFASTL